MRSRSARGDRRWRRVLSACLLAASLAGPAARGSPGAVHLVYMRGAGAERCPSREELQRGIIARLGRDPFWGRGARPVWVTISRSGTELVATIAAQAEDSGPAQVRAVTSRRHECAELASAVELALAIAIDPDAALGGPPGAGAGPAEPLPEPIGPRAGLTQPSPAPPEPPTLVTTASPDGTGQAGDATGGRWFAGASVLLSAGTAPSPSAGLALDVGVRRRAWSLAIEGRADYPTEVGVSPGAVTAGPILAAVVPCYHLGWFAGCAVAAAGALLGSARDLPRARVDATPYFAAGIRLAAERGIGARFALGAHLDLLGTLTPTHLWANQTEVWRTPAASATLGLSAIQHF